MFQSVLFVCILIVIEDTHFICYVVCSKYKSEYYKMSNEVKMNVISQIFLNLYNGSIIVNIEKTSQI